MPRPQHLLGCSLLLALATAPGCKRRGPTTPPPPRDDGSDLEPTDDDGGDDGGENTSDGGDGGSDDGGGEACGGEPLTVTFFDAGQALSALVTLPDKRRILVDVGENPKRMTCGAPCKAWHKRVVEGIHTELNGDAIDMLWVTHQHSDHHGGLPGLAASYPNTVLHNYVDNGTREEKNGVINARAAAKRLSATPHEVYPGHTSIPIADAADVELDAIVPDKWPRSCTSDPNDCSIGLLITYCDSKILFTGDAEEPAEKVWEVGDISLLQVGHHGSNTSSTKDFIDQVKPEYAVISSGKRDEGTNKGYCHPIKSTVDRVSDATGGPKTKSFELYDASTNKCSYQTPDDWKTVAFSNRLWLTAHEGTIRLRTTGDGTFTEVGSSTLVNINTATKAELDALPGIGPAKAQAVIDYRQANGPFSSIADLENVPGIGPSTMAGLAGLITTQ